MSLQLERTLASAARLITFQTWESTQSGVA